MKGRWEGLEHPSRRLGYSLFEVIFYIVVSPFLGKAKYSSIYFAFRSVCTNFELRSKVLPFGNAQINLAFRSLNRNFAAKQGSGLSLASHDARGKSGQHRVSHFRN